MIVTDLKYHLETKLVKKIDLMIKHCTNKKVRLDALLICEGRPGHGKTNSSEAIAYYIKHKTKRQINMFFSLKKLVDFAKSTNKKIIIWDEPAIDSLSIDWYNECNKDLIRLLMTCRKKRHFLIFNFVKFYKFNEYITKERASGLIHMYLRKGVVPGRFYYIRQSGKKNIETLYELKNKKKQNIYSLSSAFGGSFPRVEQHIPVMQIHIEGNIIKSIDEYENYKDKAIASIGNKKIITNKDKSKLNELKIKVGELSLPIITQKQLAFHLSVTTRALRDWKKLKITK